MDDLISRQDAIDAVEFGITYAKAINKSTGEVKELFKEGNKALNDAVERIKDLPSAQSEPSQAARDIATILENEKDMRVIKKNAESESCADTISRQAAINALMEFDKKLRKINWYQYPYIEHECRGVDKAIVKIANLPSAQPERQKGEWIDYTEDGYVECPFCHSATNCDGNKDELHFCFSCGADMRGEQDG